MTHFNAKLAEVVRKDPRYAYEAYEFIFQALHHTQQMLGRVPPEKKEETEDGEPPNRSRAITSAAGNCSKASVHWPCASSA